MSGYYFISKDCTPRTIGMMEGDVMKWKEHSAEGWLGGQVIKSPRLIPGPAS